MLEVYWTETYIYIYTRHTCALRAHLVSFFATWPVDAVAQASLQVLLLLFIGDADVLLLVLLLAGAAAFAADTVELA